MIVIYIINSIYYIQSVKVILDLFSENPDVYDRVAVVSFHPNILYKVQCVHWGVACMQAKEVTVRPENHATAIIMYWV